MALIEFENNTDEIIEEMRHKALALYKFLAGVSGMEEQEIAKLPLGTFTQMIIDIFKKEEFGDFFQVVSGLVK